MVTTEVIQGAFQAVVESLKTTVNFYSVWSDVTDQKAQTAFPACFWKGTDTTMTAYDSYALRDGFIIECMFIDQTAKDRSTQERDQAYARMNTAARLCWARFYDLYIANTGTYQGVTIDLSPQDTSEARFLRVGDSGTMQMTGCLLQVTVVTGGKLECLDTYFNES